MKLSASGHDISNISIPQLTIRRNFASHSAATPKTRECYFIITAMACLYQPSQENSGCLTRTILNISQSHCTTYRLGLLDPVCSCLTSHMREISSTIFSPLWKSMKRKMSKLVRGIQMPSSRTTATVFYSLLARKRKRYLPIPTFQLIFLHVA